MRRWLADPVAGPALGGLIGLGAFASSLGLAIVDPRFIDWVMYGDLRIHFLGWHTYRGGPWVWPLGVNTLFGYPVGTSVALTDSLPLFAVTFKALDSILPTRFQYIGLWLLLCFVLQGVFGALLMRVVTARVSLQALGSAMFVFAPVLLHRAGHPALTAHWLLLAAWWLHVRSDDERPLSRHALAWWAAIVIVAAATHAYMAFMVMAMATAHVAGHALGGRRAAVRAAISVGAMLAVAVVVAWQAGYFIVESAGDLDPGDFGDYSMNLLAPVTPLAPASTVGPLILPSMPDAPEVYSYLGLGVLLLIAATPVAMIGSGVRLPRGVHTRHWPMAILLAAFTAMALGPVVAAGASTLVSYDGSWWGPLTIFRANHRMFWPVLYGITFLGLIAACRHRPGVAVVLIAGAVVVQAVDLSHGYVVARRIREAEWRTPLDDSFWRVAPPHYARLIAVPSNMCAVERTVDFEPLSLIAGDFRVPVNAGMAARFGASSVRDYCAALARQIAAGVFDPDALYVLQRDRAADVMPRIKDPIICVPVDGYVACVARDTYVRWQDGFDATSGVLPPLAEFLNGYGDLDDEYGRMLRTPVALAGTREERVGAIRMYLVYRLTGCDHGQALDKIVRTLAGEPEPRACGNPMGPRSPLPRPDEIFAFRRDLDRQFRRLGRPEQATRIDLEGEAVWLLEYARARLADQSDEAAQDTVREMVRRVAGR